MSDLPEVKVEEKLGLLQYKADRGRPHIKILDPETCLHKCPDKPCTKLCPAKVYEWDEARKTIVVSYENCIECGAARMLCPFYNIFWEPPRGGFGVSYRYG